MSKNNRNRDAVANVEASTPVITVDASAPAQADQTPTAMQNFTLFRHRADHPGNRSSYTIPGVPGNVVFFNSLFADGQPPETLMLNVPLQSPKADKKTEKAELAAMKAAERARKAQERNEAQQAKIAERQAKLAAQVEAARKKLAETAAAVASAEAADADVVASAN